jgi:hypothetical protein
MNLSAHAGILRLRVVTYGLCLVALVSATIGAQSVTMETGGGAVRVRSGFSFIDGEVLGQLRDGRSVRVDLELTVLAGPRDAALAAAKRSFNLSFDLWEERFAVTQLGAPARSVSHLRSRDAEAWCLQAVSVPRTELGRLSAGAPFWIRLSVQAPDLAVPAGADADDIFTIRRLIDVFSRRTPEGDPAKVVEAGPFHLTP